MKLLLPIMIIGAALGLFIYFTNPTFQETKGLQAQVNGFNEALDKAKELKVRRDQLLAKRNAFATTDVQKLERLLPDNVDNIRFVIDINNIATRRGLFLQNVALGAISDSKAIRSALAVGASGDQVGSAEISFSLSASYDDFLAFLQDLEHSLRIVDVEKISFRSAESGNTYDFDMTIRTYWLH